MNKKMNLYLLKKEFPTIQKDYQKDRLKRNKEKLLKKHEAIDKGKTLKDVKQNIYSTIILNQFTLAIHFKVKPTKI